jgi:pseudouridine-5'-monophosphatase
VSALQGKPDPQIFLQAADGFTERPASPAHCLVFEDAPTGVQAGVAAGMNVVMVPDANLDKSHIEGLGAAAVLGSLEQFVPEHWGLPAYSSSSSSTAQA